MRTRWGSRSYRATRGIGRSLIGTPSAWAGTGHKVKGGVRGEMEPGARRGDQTDKEEKAKKQRGVKNKEK